MSILSEVRVIEPKVAKLFKNGASQAVRLPAEFRFEGDQVYVSRDPKTQDVILSQKPGLQVWGEFFARIRSHETQKDWMNHRPMNALSMDDEPPLFSEDD